MSDAVETARLVWNGVFARGEVHEIARLIDDEEIATANRRLLAADAPIEFPTPYGGAIGEMGGPFTGPDGLHQAWAEWVKAWPSFRVRIDEWLEPRPGVVLLLGQAWGRLLGSDAELEVPIAAICEVTDGQIVRMQHFLDQDQARQAAEA